MNEQAKKVVLEKLEVFGDSGGFSASLEGCTGKDVGLHSCLFCQSTDQVIRNTHTPYYSIDCQCGLTLESYHRAEDGGEYSEVDGDAEYKSKAECTDAHMKAIEHIVNKWQKATNKFVSPEFNQKTEKEGDAPVTLFPNEKFVHKETGYTYVVAYDDGQCYYLCDFDNTCSAVLSVNKKNGVVDDKEFHSVFEKVGERT